MESHRCQAVALLSPTRGQPRLLFPPRPPYNPGCSQRQRPPQRWIPCPLSPRRRWLPSQIHLAGRHQIRQLLHLAGPHLYQRLKVLSQQRGNRKRPPHTSQPRRPLHQDRSNLPPYPAKHRQQTSQVHQRASPMGKTHQHALHRQHRTLPCPLPQRQPIPNGRLPLRH